MMMKRSISCWALLIAGLLAPNVFAGIITIQEYDGSKLVYKLKKLKSSPTGAVVIDAVTRDTGSTIPTITLNASEYSKLTVGSLGQVFILKTAPKYDLSISTVPITGGSITGAASGSYPVGTAFSLVAAPSSGYIFSSWGGACEATTTPTCVVTMNADTSVVANFTADTVNYFTLTLTSSPAAGGTITGETSGVSLASGTQRTLSAVPNTGYTFSGWAGACAGTDVSATCTVTMNDNLTVLATFEEDAAPECGTTPANVRVVNTSVPDRMYSSTKEMPTSKEEVIAYKFTTTSDTSKIYQGYMKTTKYVYAELNKYLVISACPGSTTPVQSNCIAPANQEVASRDYVVNDTTGQYGRYYCHLEPNSTYYVNAFSKENLTDAGYSCTGGSTCYYMIDIK
jgi:uncharacterized repeat protein (TIGR02543 family)